MQIRLTYPGFAGFTGYFGNIKFEDGVSEHISSVEAERLGCIVACETLEGENPSATQRMVDVRNKDLNDLHGTGHEVSNLGAQEQNQVQTENQVDAQSEGQGESVNSSAEKPKFDFTREDLEALADAEGIAGLRNLGSQHGIKGRSIVEIIEELLALKEAAESNKE